MIELQNYNDPKLDKETQNQLFRIYVEGKLADFHQKIYQLQQQLSGWEAVQKNVNDRLDTHGSDLAKLQHKVETNEKHNDEDIAILIKQINKLESNLLHQSNWNIWNFLKKK